MRAGVVLRPIQPLQGWGQWNLAPAGNGAFVSGDLKGASGGKELLWEGGISLSIPGMGDDGCHTRLFPCP